MTTYARYQHAGSYRFQHTFARTADIAAQPCEDSLLQMSGTPWEQWTYISDSRYPNNRTQVPDEDSQQQVAILNPPYTAQGPPRFLFPGSQGQEPSHSRLPAQGRVWDSGSDSRHRYPPTTTGSLAQYSIQRPAAPRNLEFGPPPSAYYETSSRGRGSVSSVSRLNDVDSQYSSSSATLPSPVHSDKSPGIYPQMAPLPNYQLPIHQRQSTVSMPSGFENILHHSPTPSPPPRPRTSSLSRCRLHIRQQPIAARACGAGDRDRRPVDPPPIIQMLLTDFDPGSEEDKAMIQDPRFTVGCLLHPVHESHWRGSSDMGLDDSSAPGQSTPLLSGKAFVSPFYVDEEPDPDTAPAHPSSDDYKTDAQGFAQQSQGVSRTPPACFFIFSDLSVRTAGIYRLQFRLMNWGEIEDTGQVVPVLAEAWSEPFRVHPAKDFPGMSDSSILDVRLKELGFVELKIRGKGIGKGRRVGKKDSKSQQD
ncbi:velvet factor-domain-containing protein [Aspergillus pseudoustus]|uniref:Velvet factor-domain-containing protein n=1 Tax=Aspergillus pseudoustus TaxID=1810923 RepID=A0ABR4KUT8_9EURO